MEIKYELIKNDVIDTGVKCYRLRALSDFLDVKQGDLGGYVSEDTILEDSWVYSGSVSGSVLKNTTVTNSYVYNSEIQNSCINNSDIDRSNIIESIITDSKIEAFAILNKTKVIDSYFCQGAHFENTNVTNKVVQWGRIIGENYEY